jgi:NAD(P)-dependent dehydrogenase (short-subunit alcohol dehydrogenase family)
MALQDLADRVAIVTGASSGLGRATCVSLAQAGVQIVAVGRDPARLAETAARVDAVQGGRRPALMMALDVRSEADMQQMADATLQRFGRIDMLVHSAGILRAAGATLRTVAQMP